MNGQLPEGATPVTLTPNETQAVRDTAIIEALNWILEVLPESSEATSRVKTLMQGIVATISIHQVDPSAGEVTADAAFEISKDFSRLLAALQEIVVADTEARKVDFFADSGAAAATRRVEALAAGRELVDEFIKPIQSVEDPNGPFTYLGVEAAIDPNLPADATFGIRNPDGSVTAVTVDPEPRPDGGPVPPEETEPWPYG